MIIRVLQYCMRSISTSCGKLPSMCVQSYPRKLAYEYLEELANEFGRLYGAQVDAVARPYAFIKFGEQPGSPFFPDSAFAPDIASQLVPLRIEGADRCNHIWD